MNAFTPIQPDTLFNAEAEQQLLGALLLDASRFHTVGTYDADIFHDEAHRTIFKEIRRRVKDDLPATPVAMKLWADGQEILNDLGAAKYLARLAGGSVSSNHVEHYAGILDDLRAKRALADAINDAQSALFTDEETAGTIAGRLEAALATGGARQGVGPVSMAKAVTAAMSEIYDIYEGKETPGVHSGIPSLDRFFGKMSPGQLILLGGRPSMGKSAVALSMALNVARSGQGVAMATLEMTPESMSQRALAEATARERHSVPYSEMSRAVTEDQIRSLSNVTREIASLPIQFLPPQYRDVGALYAGAKRCKSILDGNLGLLVVDYLQLLRADGRSRIEQITQISIALKSLAMNLQVPVLALSQLSRAVEQRDEKRPIMSDLRESGQLEQDADAILFCYRDEYYLEREEPEADSEEYDAWEAALQRSRNCLEIIVAKQRQGAIGTAHVRFNPALNLIWEDAQ